MSKYRIWTISILLLFAAFASIGVFEPTLTLSSSFLVNRSAATTFRVLTQPASLNELVENVSKIEPLVEHKDNIGNRYRILLGEKGSSSELEGKLIQFVDLEQFSYLYTTHSVEIEASYSLVRAETGAIVQVVRQIFPQSWWRRSFLPLVSRAEAAKQIRINDRLVKLIESSPESLIGDWVSTGPDGVEQMFSFRSDGTVDWRVALGASVFPLSGLHWQRKTSIFPEFLDLSGFASGPLDGLSLFGIIDMTRRDTLLFDAEAGFPDDDRIRPTDFSASTVTYVRIR